MNLKKGALLLLLIVGACEADVVKRGGGKQPEGLSPAPDFPSIDDGNDRDPTGAGGSTSTGGRPSLGTGGDSSPGTGGRPPGAGGASASGGTSIGDGDGDLGGAAGSNFGGMGGDTPLWVRSPRL